jgi:uncharacterized protein (TIGR03067 family)
MVLPRLTIDCTLFVLLIIRSISGYAAPENEREQKVPEHTGQPPERNVQHCKSPDNERKAKAVKEEMTKLEGTWGLAEHTNDSGLITRFRSDNRGRNKITIVGNKWSFRNDAGKVETCIQVCIDPTTTPKSMEWSYKDAFKSEVVRYTIYELNGDELKLRELHYTRQSRPKEMKIPFKGARVISSEDEEFIDCYKRIKP